MWQELKICTENPKEYSWHPMIPQEFSGGKHVLEVSNLSLSCAFVAGSLAKLVTRNQVKRTQTKKLKEGSSNN